REAQNRHQEAASLYRRSLTIREQVLGKEHPRTVLVQQRLSTMQALLEEKEEMMKNARETL
ncbi:MAG TPA: tetratricopeptide repeat protein, partial [Ktedonobacteraceae bacterium]|nr:tetratricopeptide repeat protein [Ktedonobacteraceae bacterium]